MIDSKTAPRTIGSVLEAAAATLRDAGIEGARRDARLLLAGAIDEPPEAVLGYPERALSETTCATFECWVERRAAREPVSRILGQREFWSLPFRISPATLDPRPESECLVQAVLDAVGDRTRPLRILDLGTGSGCLLLALLSECPQASGLGIDLDPAAVAQSRENATYLGLEERATFAVGDWAHNVSGFWQVIVSNPPYIKKGDLLRLEPEVRDFDPKLALDGGPDGLSAYRLLIREAAERLAPDGVMALEIGLGQEQDVAEILRGCRLEILSSYRDLAGIVRGLVAGPASNRGESENIGD